jgi:hypothetical protein
MKKFTFLLCFLASSLFIMADVPDVIISQVYGGGGNAGATYKSDFIELYNTTGADINIGGWSIQYGSATGVAQIGTSNIDVFPAGTIIKAHSHYSIKCADGANGAEWPAGTFDWEPSTNVLNLSGSAGKVILMKNDTRVTPATLSDITSDAAFGDYLPFGTTAVPVYGSAMANLTNTQSALRKFAAGEYQYTGNIGDDFELATPNPRKTPTEINQVVTPVISPSNGSVTSPVTVSISSATEGATIYYTTDGTDPTTASTLYADPFILSATTTVKAFAVKGGFDDSEIATKTYTFPATVANIAAFNALSANDVATITGEVTVVYQNGTNLFIQDESGWLIVYGATTKTFTNGDRITGLTGSFALYQNAPELVLISGLAIPDAVAGDEAEAFVIDPANLSNPEDINRYVEFSDVVVAADFTYSTSEVTEGSIVVGNGTMTIRNHYKLFSGSYTTGSHLKIKGIVKTYQSAFSIYVLSIETPSATQEDLQVNNIDVFAQDGKITVSTTDRVQKIEVYDITGRQLLKTTQNTFSIDHKGMILVRVTTDKASFFSKVIVK